MARAEKGKWNQWNQIVLNRARSCQKKVFFVFSRQNMVMGGQIVWFETQTGKVRLFSLLIHGFCFDSFAEAKF
jgi:hypothetical protein